MYGRQVSHSDTELSFKGSDYKSKKRSASATTESRYIKQESFISIRSRKSSGGKNDLPDYVCFRSKSSLSLHILDVYSKEFESLCQSNIPKVSCFKLNNEMSEFIDYWTDPIFRLYFLLFLSQFEYQTLFVSILTFDCSFWNMI